MQIPCYFGIRLVAAALCSVLALPALAVDGVIEINHALALAGASPRVMPRAIP